MESENGEKQNWSMLSLSRGSPCARPVTAWLLIPESLSSTSVLAPRMSSPGMLSRVLE